VMWIYWITNSLPYSALRLFKPQRIFWKERFALIQKILCTI